MQDANTTQCFRIEMTSNSRYSHAFTSISAARIYPPGRPCCTMVDKNCHDVIITSLCDLRQLALTKLRLLHGLFCNITSLLGKRVNMRSQRYSVNKKDYQMHFYMLAIVPDFLEKQSSVCRVGHGVPSNEVTALPFVKRRHSFECLTE